jgi:hypothetical protein
MEQGACVSHHLPMSAETSITQADASLWGHLPESLGNGADLDAWAERRRSTAGGGSTREEKRRVGRPRAKEKKKETLHKAVDETSKQAGGRRNIAWAQLPFLSVPAAKVDQPRGIGVWTRQILLPLAVQNWRDRDSNPFFTGNNITKDIIRPPGQQDYSSIQALFKNKQSLLSKIGWYRN